MNYSYDDLERVTAIADGSDQRAAYAYAGPSRVCTRVLKNGSSVVATERLEYDAVGRVTSGLYRNASDNATIIGFGHGYDLLGHPKYEARSHQGNKGDAYIYDKLYRCTRTIYDDSNPASPTYNVTRAEDFIYDKVGNRLTTYIKSSSPTTYALNYVNEYTSVGGTSRTYDAAGNLTHDGTYSYQWDYENRLTRVTSGGNTVAAYRYDAKNRRVQKEVGSGVPPVTTRYILDGWNEIEERDQSGTLQATYVHGPGMDDYLTMIRNSVTYWYMQSPLNGNVAALVDSSGALQEGYTYTGYGTATVHTAPGSNGWFSDDTTGSVSAIGNPFMFTGRRLDPETELYYFRMRMYCSAIGSFISRDPNGYVDGMSLYLGYFAPWGLDPLGLCKETFWGKLRESFRDFVWKSGDSFGKNLSRLTGRCLSEVRRAGVARG